MHPPSLFDTTDTPGSPNTSYDFRQSADALIIFVSAINGSASGKKEAKDILHTFDDVHEVTRVVHKRRLKRLKFEDLPLGLKFDFVIAGGGTAGSVLANRLTENPNFQVLLIEDGPSNIGVLNSEVPFFAPNLLNSPFDWNFTTTPQVGLNGRSIVYPRGHLLGGSSSINDMFYTRGSSSDYDRFAAVTGDPGWSWAHILPYLLKNERWVPPADNHSTLGQFDPAFHNTKGVNLVSLPGFPQRSTDGRVIQTTKDLEEEFPFNLDMNSGDPLGVGWLQSTIGHGARSSAATSYLAPQFIDRKNMHVLVETRVTRIIPTTTPTGESLAFHTVEILSKNGTSRQQITALKEVILSTGSIGTPHILLSSGIGNATELKAVGVQPILNMPSVGKNMTDHPLIGFSWVANSTDTVDNINNNATLLTELLVQWEKTRTGPLVDESSINQVGFFRLPKNSTIFKQFSDPSSGPNSAHYELAFANGASFDNGPGNFIGIGVAVVSPASRGSVTLAINNPINPPVIDPAILKSDFDIFTMKQAVQSARAFYAGPAWKNYVLQPTGAFANATTDDALEQFLRNNAFNAFHPVGTSAMSPKGANHGVVDPDLCMKNVVGVRIVDASVMPFVICGHTQAPTYAIAERAADLIKEAWK